MKKILKALGRLLAVLLLTVLFVVINAAAVCAALAYGPSPVWQSRFVAAFDGNSPMNFLPRLFLPDETIEEILHPEPEAEVPDPFVELSFEEDSAVKEDAGSSEVADEPPEEDEENGDVIELIRIKEPTFRGAMLVVHDPSLIEIGTLDHFGGQGMLLSELIEKYGAIGGANGAGFYAPGGSGPGGSPDGMVIKDGEIIHGSAGGWYRDVMGFDSDYVFHVGDMTGREALELGIVSGLSFNVGPVLIKDGEIQPRLDDEKNYHTCLGQTADGTVLLLVVEGRRSSSLGATNQEMAQIMYDHGAVNAGNLDGGGSSNMYYRGEQLVYNDYMLKIPTAILVMPPEKGDE